MTGGRDQAEWAQGCLGEWMVENKCDWTDGWMEWIGWMDGRMDGWRKGGQVRVS